MQGMTAAEGVGSSSFSSSKGEKENCMSQVLATAWHGLLHEGFNVANTSLYNRDYFGWANALFSEWVIADYLI